MRDRPITWPSDGEPKMTRWTISRRGETVRAVGDQMRRAGGRAHGSTSRQGDVGLGPPAFVEYPDGPSGRGLYGKGQRSRCERIHLRSSGRGANQEPIVNGLE
jgi:hypothetical protein